MSRGRERPTDIWDLHDSCPILDTLSPYKTFIFKCVKFPFDKGLYSLKMRANFQI